MKRSIIFLVVLVAVLLQSCIIKSLHPFFTEKDLVFKPELVDTWQDQDGNNWIIRPVKEKVNAYEMIFRKNGATTIFIVHLFQLENQLYVDFLPLSTNAKSTDFFNMHLLPTHSVAKVTITNKNEMLIQWFNEDWMKNLFDQNRIKIAHEAILDESPRDQNDKSYVLTASTSELQKFLIKFGSDEEAFNNIMLDGSVYLKLNRAI